MPVRKYRSIENVPEAAVGVPRDPRNLQRACDLSVAAARLAPRRFPSGVHRYRSLDHAWEQRENWERSSTPRSG
jgi:hypothetical protein